jgi:hypothetical protein
MEYTNLIRDAWTMTWRHRYLWVLGLFTGTAAGSCSGTPNPMQYRLQSGDLPNAAPGIEAVGVAVGSWIAVNQSLVVATLALAGLLGVGLIIASFIAQGGLTEATVDLARNEPASLGRAWRAGCHFFWRYVGLTLLLIAVAVGIGLVVSMLGVLIVGAITASAGILHVAMIVVGVLLALSAVAVVIPIAVGLCIAISYAQRIIVVDDTGPRVALRAGWTLLRANVATSLIVWLLDLALTIAATVAIAFVTVVVAVILGIVGYVLWTIAGFTAITIVYLSIGVALTLASFFVLEAIANTFLWSYWTLAYLRLGGQSRVAAA